MFDEQSWEQRYRSHAAVWSDRPNIQLVTEASHLTAGAALDGSPATPTVKRSPSTTPSSEPASVRIGSVSSPPPRD